MTADSGDFMSKEGWTTVTLGDIAENISVRVVDPSKSGLDRFVGLEHLDSGSVTVTRWGSTSEFSSGKRFQAGDVLLCRRRPYLRKCSAADFDGVCSGDAYVLREKPDAIVPGLLKYILNANRFWEYAIANADGSMSSRVKWEKLSEYELILPSSVVQDNIYSILEASTHNIEFKQILLKMNISALIALGTNLLDKFPRNHSFKEYCDVNPESISKEQLSSDDSWNYIDLSSISFPNKFENSKEIILSSAPSRARRIVKSGDLVISTVRPNLRGHGVIELDEANTVASTGYCVLRPHNKSLSLLMLCMFFSNQFSYYVKSTAKGSNYPAISSKDIVQFLIPDLNDGRLLSFADLATNFCQIISKMIHENIPNQEQLQRQLLDDLL